MSVTTDLTELEDITSDIVKMVSNLTTIELNWKTSTGFWSIAQILQHMERFNLSYIPILEKIKEGRFKEPKIAAIPGLPGLFGYLLKQSVSSVRRFKMKTFHIWEPSESDKIENSLQTFQSHQMMLISEINATFHAAGGDIIIHSPASQWIVYRLDTAINLIVSHEKRHCHQINDVLDQLKGTDNG